MMSRHLDLMVEVFGETHGCRMFRKVAPWYAKRFGPASEFNKRVVLVSSKAEFDERAKEWKPRAAEFTSGYLWKYAQQVGAARYGALTHPGGAAETVCYADI